MRPVLHGDLSCAARALLSVPKARRPALCQQMIVEAQAADIHVQRNGRLHPRWGNGSLMAAARSRVLATEPGFDDIEYCRCLVLLLRSLIRHRVSQRRS